MLALETGVFRRTPRIVAIARRGRDEIARLYGVPAVRLRVVYNGVDLDRFHPDNRERYRAALRAELAIPSGAWVILFAGSGFERKGLSCLLDALGRRREPAWRLVVLGKGDTALYRAQGERLGIAPYVVWARARPDIERWYGAADVVALPSRYEPFGNVHLEALASGVPVVASAVAGGAELIEDGRNGAVTPPDDPVALAEALARLASAPAASLREAARRSATPFTYEAQVAGFQQIYAEVPLLRQGAC
jgi:UDP-glucose:(heptosyl)LPS alpha-1,3-glucosyltransferase